MARDHASNSCHYESVGGGTGFNLVANVYPVLHLRRVRARLDRVRSRRGANQRVLG